MSGPGDVEPLPWWQMGACQDYPITGGDDPWFPDRGGHDVWGRARRICLECPVRAACLARAQELETCASALKDRFGMWGGMTPIERHEAAKEQRRAS